MRQLLFFFLLLPVLLAGQKPSSPHWTNDYEGFNSAKLQVFNISTNKYAAAVYKDAFIVLNDALDPEQLKLTINIPDHFYLKLGELFSMRYEREHDGGEIYHYTVIEANKMAMVSFYYIKDGDTPYQIVVSGKMDYKSSKNRTLSYVLSEFK